MRFLVVLLLLTLASCKEREAPPAPTPPPLQMLSTGGMPKRILRYHPSKATKQTFDIAIDTDLTAGTVDSSLPTLVITMALGVDEVLADGRIKLRATVLDATATAREDSRVQPAPVAALVKQLSGVALRSTMSPGGQASNVKVDTAGKKLPAELDGQLATLTASFARVMMPLPDEAVGVGASWRNSLPIEQNGLKMTAVNTITLTAIEGERVSFAIETQIHGADQSVMQGAMRIDVKDITGTGKGNASIDLGTLAMTSQLQAELRTDMTAAGDEQGTPMRMAMLTKLTPR